MLAQVFRRKLLPVVLLAVMLTGLTGLFAVQSSTSGQGLFGTVNPYPGLFIGRMYQHPDFPQRTGYVVVTAPDGQQIARCDLVVAESCWVPMTTDLTLTAEKRDHRDTFHGWYNASSGTGQANGTVLPFADCTQTGPQPCTIRLRMFTRQQVFASFSPYNRDAGSGGGGSGGGAGYAVP